jgi:hypothetical protein
MEKLSRLRFAGIAAYSKLLLPISIQRRGVFWLAVVLLVLGVLIASADFIHTYRDDINAVSTIFIAVFTAVLGIFTVNLARSTRIAANAARDAITHVERPLLIVRTEVVPNKILVKVMNCGRMPATLTEVGAQFFGTDELPAIPDKTNATVFKYDYAILPLTAIDNVAYQHVGSFGCSEGAKTAWVWVKYGWSVATYERSTGRQTSRPYAVRGGTAYNYDKQCDE